MKLSKVAQLMSLVFLLQSASVAACGESDTACGSMVQKFVDFSLGTGVSEDSLPEFRSYVEFSEGLKAKLTAKLEMGDGGEGVIDEFDILYDDVLVLMDPVLHQKQGENPRYNLNAGRVVSISCKSARPCQREFDVLEGQYAIELRASLRGRGCRVNDPLPLFTSVSAMRARYTREIALYEEIMREGHLPATAEILARLNGELAGFEAAVLRAGQ